MTSLKDIRPTARRFTRVDGGVLYLRGNQVQVWWDDGSAETWTAPDNEQALANYTDMADRWNTA